MLWCTSTVLLKCWLSHLEAHLASKCVGRHFRKWCVELRGWWLQTWFLHACHGCPVGTMIPSPQVSSYYEAIARIPLATLTLISRYLPGRLGQPDLPVLHSLTASKHFLWGASISRTLKVLEPQAFQQTLIWHSWFILKHLVHLLPCIGFLVLVLCGIVSYIIFIRYILFFCPKTWQVTSAAVHRPGRADSGSSLASPNARPSPRPSTGFPGTRTATADGRLAGCDAGDCLAGPGWGQGKGGFFVISSGNSGECNWVYITYMCMFVCTIG